MLLGRHVEWSLHSCLVLAELSARGYISTSALASLFHLPKEYLSKGLQELSRAGILARAMGPTGGYRLSKPAAQISVLDIVEAVVGDQPTYQDTGLWLTVSKDGGDPQPGACPVTEMMLAADAAWRSSLRNITLSDLLSAARAARTQGHADYLRNFIGKNGSTQ